MRKRWFVYAFIGTVFGVFDFYYQISIYNIFDVQGISGPGMTLVRSIPVLGIWLVPVIPVILHEARFSRSSWLSALTSALTWSAAMVGYYLTNAFQLAVIGVSSRQEMHISNFNDPYFWANWRGVFLEALVADNLGWMVVAVTGGSVIGFALSFVYLRLQGSMSRT